MPNAPKLTNLRSQQAYFIAELNQAIENAPTENTGNGTITIQIPGATTFTLRNDKEILRGFLKMAGRKFWNKLPQCKDSDPRPVSTESRKVTSLGEPLAAADLLKIASHVTLPCSDESSRKSPLNFVLIDGREIVATDESRMLVIHGNLRKRAKQSYFDPASGSFLRNGISMPAWATWNSRIPQPASAFATDISTSACASLLTQAGEIGEDDSWDSDGPLRADIWSNPDGTIGVVSAVKYRGFYEGNIIAGAKLIGTYNLSYLQDAIKLSRQLGHETVCMEAAEDVRMRPRKTLVIRGTSKEGKPFTHLITPLAVLKDIFQVIECPNCRQVCEMPMSPEIGVRDALRHFRDQRFPDEPATGFQSQAIAYCPICETRIPLAVLSHRGKVTSIKPSAKL